MRKKATVRHRRAEERDPGDSVAIETPTQHAVQEFVVERIMQRRVTHGRVEYFLKWKGFTEADSTWEPEDNLDCPELIQEFLRGVVLDANEMGVAMDTTEMGGVIMEPRLQPKEEEEEDLDTVQRFLDMADEESVMGNTHTRTHTHSDRIIGCTDRHGELTFLIQWKGGSDVSLMSAREATERNPEMVIDFYTHRLTQEED
ncbi:chromobox protein homolog 3b [Engraulis encrasicolus]|uniref:chromobox protein homolog 3b n=1 Tax=Engraulis encrasicolus TaxID=184585 RepID=UPI002FD535AD